MKTIELEKLIADVIENIETKKAVMVSTFKEEGVLTTDRGLVVRIGDDEFEITIVRV